MCLPKQRSTFSDCALYALCAVVPLWIMSCTGLLRVAGLPSLAPRASEPLPSYHLSLQGSPEITHTRLRSDGMLRISLLPQTRVAGPVSLHAFVSPSRPASARSWPVEFEALDGGGFMLQAPVGELPGLRPGSWKLTIIIQRSRLWHRLFSPDSTCPDRDRKGCTSFQVQLEIVAS